MGREVCRKAWKEGNWATVQADSVVITARARTVTAAVGEGMLWMWCQQALPRAWRQGGKLARAPGRRELNQRGLGQGPWEAAQQSHTGSRKCRMLQPVELPTGQVPR